MKTAHDFLAAVLFAGAALIGAAASGAIPAVVTKQIPSALYGEPYTARLFVAASPALQTLSLTGLPTGLDARTDLLGNVTISGTPLTEGQFSLTLTARNADGGLVNPTIALNVRRVPPATRIAAGGVNACAIVSGGVQCWGTQPRNPGEPTAPYFVVPVGSDVSSIATQGLGFCAVARGGVLCWSGFQSNAPLPIIASGSGATSVALGSVHGCAVVNGGVQCWGANSGGQLGNGTQESRFDASEIPVPTDAIPPGSGVVAVSAGVSHTCALVNGGVRCWGANDAGQLGNGTTVNRAFPTAVFPDGSGITALTAGHSHTCAVAKGGVKCWGSNMSGELGIGSTINALAPATTLPEGSGATLISAGGNFIFTGRSSGRVFAHTCALVSERLKCWGDNSAGQLGIYLGTSSLTPIDAEASTHPTEDIALGQRHTCVLRAGVMSCWGERTAGWGGAPASFALSPVVTLPAGSGVNSVATGERHVCAAINGGAICWGANSAGQLGNGSLQDSVSPVIAIPPGRRVESLSVSSEHSCAVADGGVSCWGRNSAGQLGDGTMSDRNAPVTAIPAGSGVRKVVASLSSTCALLERSVRCWGTNAGGSFFGSAQNVPSSPVPLEIATPASGVIDLALGFQHVCWVVAGGVQCWGPNANGAVGDGSFAARTAPVQVIATGSNATAIASRGATTCAVVGDGVQCWGGNFSSETLAPTSPTLLPYPTLPLGSGATGISAGTAHFCAITHGGVTCWGNNAAGELGNGSLVSSSQGSGRFSPIPPESGVLALSAGASATCAALSGGVFCWGTNIYGMLGDPTSYPRGAFNIRLASLPTIAPIATSTSVSADRLVARAGDTVTLTAVVSPSPTPVTPLQFTSNGVAIHGCALIYVGSNGTATCNAKFFETGAKQIVASYLGTSIHQPSTGILAAQIQIDKGDQTLSTSGTLAFVAAPPITTSLTIAASSKLPPTIEALTATVCSITPQPFGLPGQYVVRLATFGTCFFRVSQTGNTHFNPAPPLEFSITISPTPTPPPPQAPQTITFQHNFTSVTLGAPPFAFTASSTSGLPVTVASETPSVCTINGNTVVIVGSGLCRISAGQSGNGSYLPAGSVGTSFEVKLPADKLSLSVKAENQTVVGNGSPIAFFGEIMTLTGVVGGVNPTGTLTFGTLSFLPPIVGCVGIPIVNGQASCVVPSRYQSLPPATFSVTYSGDVLNSPGLTSQQVNADYSTPRLSIAEVASTATQSDGRTTLMAIVRGQSPSGTISFHAEGDNPQTDPGLPGCTATLVQPLNTSALASYATCVLSTSASGERKIHAVYRIPNAANLSYQATTTVRTIANAPPNYSDMWWGGQRENGWGVSITQHGAQQFNVIYAYDSAGKPTWYVMPGCTWNAGNTACTGSLYSPTGSPFSAYDVTRFAANAAVGTASFTYKTTSTATMTYTINGVSGTKEIERQQFGTASTHPTLAVNDLWWNGLAENGWGLNITQQGQQLFPVWYTYDANGKPTFYAVPGGTWNGLVFTGDMYTTTSSPWLGAIYDASKFVATKVGTMVIDFRDASTATITYTVGAVTQTKMIVRQPF